MTLWRSKFVLSMPRIAKDKIASPNKQRLITESNHDICRGGARAPITIRDGMTREDAVEATPLVVAQNLPTYLRAQPPP